MHNNAQQGATKRNKAKSVKFHRNLVFSFLVFLIGSCSPTENQEVSPSNGSTEFKTTDNSSASNAAPILPQADWSSNETWNELFMMNLLEEMSKSDKCFRLTLSDGIFVATEITCSTSDPDPTPERKECRLKSDTNPITGFSKIKAFIGCARDIVDTCGSAHIQKTNGEYVVSGCE